MYKEDLIQELKDGTARVVSTGVPLVCHFFFSGQTTLLLNIWSG
jgi:hypothetical protein